MQESKEEVTIIVPIVKMAENLPNVFSFLKCSLISLIRIMDITNSIYG